MICSAVRRCQEEQDRHFHQLFCSPRTTTRSSAAWNPVKRDLGHGDNLLDNRRRVDLLWEFHHLVPQLRHKHIEDLNVRHDVHDVRRGVRRTPGSGRTSTRSVGRAASTSPSSSSVKYCVLAASGGGVFWPMALLISRSSLLLLALFCPLGAAWCCVSARSMAVSRSCRRNWRNRRCRRLLAVPASSAQRADHTDSTERSLVNKRKRKPVRTCCCWLLLLLDVGGCCVVVCSCVVVVLLLCCCRLLLLVVVGVGWLVASHTVQEPALGLLGAALDRASLCTKLWSPRGRGSLSQRK